MSRARTDMAEIEGHLTQCVDFIRATLDPKDGSREDLALCGIETFCAIALRVMKKTNPSKVASEARTFEIQAHMDGKPFLLGTSEDLKEAA